MDNLKKISRSEVKERVQINEAIDNGKRTDKDLSEKERELFKLNYRFVDNKTLAKQFLISTDDVERLAHEMKVYKDPGYTKSALGNRTDMPSRLIEAVTQKLTEEERREIMTLKNEGIDTVQMMEELILIQRTRIQRGAKLEADRDGMHKLVNDAVDTAGVLLVKLHEMRQEGKSEGNITIDQMILESQGKN